MGNVEGMVTLDGISINLSEIEQVLTAHPAVLDAAAFLINFLGPTEISVCAVTLAEGRAVSEHDLLDFARGHLSSRSPSRIAVLKTIPRNEQGKILTTALQDAVLTWMDAGNQEAANLARRSMDPSDVQRGQLLSPVRFAFVFRERPDFERLDAWLGDVLRLDIQGPLLIQKASNPGMDVLARAWLGRVLLLSRLLLQAARIPVFDRPQVISLFPDSELSGNWQVRAVFARVDELPASAYDIALKGAFQLNAWAMANPVNAQNLQSFYDMMQSVRSKLMMLWKAGKSTLPVLREAHRQAIPFTHLGAGVFQLGWGCNGKRFDRSVTGLDSAIGAKLSGNKALSATLLRNAGLPAPTHAVVAELTAALHAAHQIGWPVVVKPVDRERGEGVVVDVGNDEQLKSAFEVALGLSRSKRVIVERQVGGVCHRLFMADDRILYAVKRLPMSVEGDGRTDIRGLIEGEVERQLLLPPWERSGIKPLDDLARAEIARVGYTPKSVPILGERVALRRIESTEWGGVDEDVTREIHPENLRIAAAAAKLFGLVVAGIDIITPDINRPWFESGAIINEVNYAPLLGGGDISRSHLPAFLARFVDGKGTVPVEVFVGGKAAWAAASQRWQEWVAMGVQAYLSHERQTLMPDGNTWHMPITGLFARARAMVLSSRVEALVLVAHTDELLAKGLPLEAVSRITVVDRHLSAFGPDGDPIPRERVDQLLRMIQGWRREEGK